MALQPPRIIAAMRRPPHTTTSTFVSFARLAQAQTSLQHPLQPSPSASLLWCSSSARRCSMPFGSLAAAPLEVQRRLGAHALGRAIRPRCSWCSLARAHPLQSSADPRPGCTESSNFGEASACSLQCEAGDGCSVRQPPLRLSSLVAGTCAHASCAVRGVLLHGACCAGRCSELTSENSS